MKNSYFFYDNLSSKLLQARVIGSYIISYQNVVGNYNAFFTAFISYFIISYQNVVGNYNMLLKLIIDFLIISYQNVVGNYNSHLRKKG